MGVARQVVLGMARLAQRLLRGEERRVHPLGGFLDSLVQSFEDCRPGLTDEAARAGNSGVEHYFLEVYERQMPRLEDAIRVDQSHLTLSGRAHFRDEIDGLVRKVVIPAYARLAASFTPKERNDFYLMAEPLHGLERGLWAVGSMFLGIFVIWAPFIPIWSKEWIALFAIGGFFFPNLRRVLALHRFEGQVNEVVARAEREVMRLDTAFLAGAEVVGGRASVGGAGETMHEGEPLLEPQAEPRSVQRKEG